MISVYKIGVEHVEYYMGRGWLRSGPGSAGPAADGTGGGSAPTHGVSGCAGGHGGSGTAVPPAGGEGSPAPSPGRSAASAKLEQPGRSSGGSDLVGYYTGRSGELAGRWAASGAMEVQAGSAVTRDQLTASLSAVDPTTGEQLGRRYSPGGSFKDKTGVERPRRRFSAFDLAYALPKSISTAWALADDATRKEIEQAFDRSVGAVVRFFQAEAVASRRGLNGVERVEVPAGATIARFDHWTSRAGDPHVHAHLLVHNRVRCDDGKWRTLDGRLIYRNAAAASMVGAAVLRAELSHRLGWVWDPVGDNWHAELAGSPKPLTDAWSKRMRVIARAAQAKVRAFEAENGREPTPDQRLALWHQAQRDTRPAKQDDGDPRDRWRAEAKELGIDPLQQTVAYHYAERRAPGEYDRAELLVARHGQSLTAAVVAAVVSQLEQLGPASRGLARPDILRTVWATLNASPDLYGQAVEPTVELDRLAHELWTHVTDCLVERDGRWYSPGLAGAEVAAVSWLASEAPPTTARADLEGLGDDQVAAVGTILDSPTRATLVIGPAGAGKTEMLGRVAEAVGTDRVLAVAPTAEAATNLGVALDVQGETAARAALADDLVPDRGWVIVDEAGQLDTRTLAALSGRAADAGARMVLVGDTAQQGSVSAGGVFQALAERPDLAKAAVLSELWRFHDRDEARATVGLRRGDPESLTYHAERERIHDSTEAELPELAADWWSDRRDTDTIITAPTLRLVAEINAEIAARRHRDGETGDAVLGTADSTIRVGDTVATRRNNRRIVASDGQWIRNGDRWVITDALPDGKIAARRLDGTATVELPADYTDHVQLGYATTQTRVQSLTVDAALCAVTVSSRREQLYVGMTRGRAENHLLVVTDRPQYDEDTPPDHLETDHIIRTVLARGGAHPLTLPAGSRLVHPDVARAHLSRIAATPHGQPLPDLPSLDSRRVLSSGVADPALGVGVEDVIGGAIGAWLDAELADDAAADDAARAWEERLLDHLEQGRDLEDLAAAPVTGPDEWAPPDHDHPTPEPDPPAKPEPSRPARPAAAPPPNTDALEDAIAAVTDTWGADHYGPYLTRAARWAAQPPPAPLDDPGPLVDLTAHYQLARRAGDQHTADHAAALMAAVADPTLRAMLTPFVRHRLGDHDWRWVAAVRDDLRARRAERWTPTLEALDDARTQLRAQLPQSESVTAAQAAVSDRRHWYEALAAWLDDGSSAARLSAVWHTTNRQTAQVLVGHHQPATDAPTTPPWEAATRRRRPAPPRLPDTLTPVAIPEPEPAPTEPPDDGHAKTRRMLQRSADWYHHQLVTSPQAETARRYLTDRGIGPDEWTRWNLGWAPDQWRGLCNHLRDDTAALEAGVANTSKGHTYDQLRRRIVFPIKDHSGNVIGFAGRKLPEDPHPAKYLNTRTTSLYHKSDTLYGIHEAANGIRTSGTAGVVEGYTDAIAAHQAGLTNVVALGGTAFTDSHLDRILTAGANHLTPAFDADPAGQAAQQRVIDQAHQAAIPVTAVTLPTGEDPASLGPDALLDHWNTGLPQPWTHIHQHLNSGDLHTRALGHRTLAHTYTDKDPILAAVAAHQALAHTIGATPDTITAWHPTVTPVRNPDRRLPDRGPNNTPSR
ncbi:MAG: relaxase domain-containing protein [bacterium]|nr:relaxase domain-containing protein [bacterium]